MGLPSGQPWVIQSLVVWRVCSGIDKGCWSLFLTISWTVAIFRLLCEMRSEHNVQYTVVTRVGVIPKVCSRVFDFCCIWIGLSCLLHLLLFIRKPVIFLHGPGSFSFKIILFFCTLKVSNKTVVLPSRLKRCEHWDYQNVNVLVMSYTEPFQDCSLIEWPYR